MARRVSSPAFVGRAGELEALDAALGRARAAETAAVFVGGESGVGKSRLVAEFERSSRAAGAQVLVGACVDLGEAELPYAPLVAALRALAREVDAVELEELAGPDREALGRLLPEFGTAVAVRVEVDALARVRLFEALLGLLARLGRRAPLVLVVEDLHWADPSTRGFLAFLVRNVRREPFVLVATYRSDELHRRHPLRAFLADVERAPGVERLELNAFSRDELAAQLEGILEAAPERSLLEDVFERSQGNAFFAEELLAASRAGGAALPTTVRDALTLRVERLAENTQRVLRVAAVVGANVGEGLLLAAAGLPEADVARAVREAVENNVLVPDPATEGYAFRHALLREALYDDLLPGERSGLHRALAEALERDSRLATAAQGAAAERAFHWSAAHRPSQALAASVEAGGEAERLSAFAEANRHFGRAVELWDAVPSEERPPQLTLVALLRRLAEATHLAADHDRAVAVARRALELIDEERDPTTAALIRERLGRYLYSRGTNVDEALDEYRAAAELTPAEASAARARLLAGEAHILMLDGVDWTRAQALCNEAIAIARSVGSAEIECSALNTLGAVVGVLGAREEGLEMLRRAMRLAKGLGAPEEVARSYVNLGELLDQDGQVEKAAAIALEGWELLRHRLASLAPALASDGASRLLRLGRWKEAAEVLAQAGRALPPNFAGSAVLIRMAELETARGELESAAAHLNEAQHFLSAGPGGMFAVQALAVSVALALARGRPEDARATLAGVLARGTPARSAAAFVAPAYVLGVRAEGDLAARARMRGDEPAEREAATRAAALLERARALVAPEASPLGPPPTELVLHVELAELELARAQDATDVEAWASHAVRWEALGRPFQAAYARLREGEAALAARSRERAGAAFSTARATAKRLGARLLLGEVEELARRARIDLGGTPDGDEFRERFGLTARELDVLRLLVEGRTNAQIGQVLYMSPKTASVHVSRLLAKLDVKTRTEAATAAHRLGLTHTPSRH